MKIKASEDIGGHYQSYAPGHGGLSFVHVVNGVATNEPVSEAIAKQLLPDSNWAVAKINGRLEGYRTMKRQSDNTLCFGDDLYKYELIESGMGAAYEFYFWENGEWERLRNESRRASIKYFLTHEHILSQPNG